MTDRRPWDPAPPRLGKTRFYNRIYAPGKLCLRQSGLAPSPGWSPGHGGRGERSGHLRGGKSSQRN